MENPTHRWSVVVLLTALIAAGPAAADIFSWVDEGGLRHFSDQPPPQHLANAPQASAPAAPVRVQPASLFERALGGGSDRIVIYTSNDCLACEAAKQYFRDHTISYTEYDINISPTARNEVEIMQAGALPVILVGDQRMAGFNADAFERIWPG